MSADDDRRDREGFEALKRRTGPHAAVPEPITGGDDSGVLDAEARWKARRAKTPSERTERLEDRMDAVDLTLVELKAGNVRLQQMTDAQTTLFQNEAASTRQMISILKSAVDRIGTRDDVVFESRVKVSAHEQMAKTDNVVDAKKTRRKLIASVVGLVTSGGVIVKLLELLIRGHV